MSEGLFALIGAIVGGALVLVGDTVRHWFEKRDRQRTELRNVGAQLAGTYGVGLTRMIGARKELAPEQLARPLTEELDFPERYRVWSRFVSTPGSEQLRPALERLSELNYRLIEKFNSMSDDDFQESTNAVNEALTHFEESIRHFTSAGLIEQRRKRQLPTPSHVPPPLAWAYEIETESEDASTPRRRRNDSFAD